MYEVEMKPIDYMSMDTISFTCEKFDIDSSGYKFTNVFIDNCKLNDYEIRSEDIGVIKIK